MPHAVLCDLTLCRVPVRYTARSPASRLASPSPCLFQLPPLPADEEGGGFFYNQDEALAGAAQAALGVNDDVDEVRLESCRSRCCGRMHCFP